MDFMQTLTATNFPEMYERFLVEPLFRPFAEAVLDHAQPRAGERVLDIACGTGIVARLAKARVGPSGRVVGADVNQQMIDLAASIAPDIEWRCGPAEALPLGSGETFDVVTCHQGFQFFPDKAAAAREMRRALAPRGRLAVATWRHLDTIPFVAELHEVAERHLGPVIDRRHAVRDPAELSDQLSHGGFPDLRVETVVRTVRFTDGTIFLRLNAMALAGMSTASKTMTDEERTEKLSRIVEDSTGVLGKYSTGAGLAFDIGTYLAIASRGDD